MKLIFKIILWVVIVVVVLFGCFLLYITITDFKPDIKESLINETKVNPIVKDTLSLISWNIGYAGLGAEMDFFYDGGKKVRPSKEMSRKYLDGIKKFVETNDSIDFWLFQEVDIKARRSHYKNEVEELENTKPSFIPVFAMNYNVPFVPVPLYEPMGFVKGGMLSLSEMSPEIAVRYAYPLIASWPDKLFLLDRCFILEKYPLKNGKYLFILNTHNSAYVYDSVLRLKELRIIKEKMLAEYDKGNYVIAGGDWNANPPGFHPFTNYNGHKFVASKVKMNPETFPPEWSWAFDSLAPTNRQNYQAFKKGQNGTTTIDYFIVSPNIDVIKTSTIDLNFENSDHNPVFLKVGLEINK